LNPLKAGDISTISRKSPSFFVFFIMKGFFITSRADLNRLDKIGRGFQVVRMERWGWILRVTVTHEQDEWIWEQVLGRQLNEEG